VNISCPICGTPLHTEDETLVAAHVEQCLIHSGSRSLIMNPPKPNIPGLPYDSPFVIVCPYSTCSQRMEAYEYFEHTKVRHSNEVSHNYACPICALTRPNRYQINEKTNLYQHVQNQHSDFQQNTFDNVTAMRDALHYAIDFGYDPGEFMYDDYDSMNFSNPKNIGSHYIEDVVKEYRTGVECTICFEEFQEGEKIARLDCFCIFHKACIDRWFEKSRKCPLHKD